MIGTIGKLGTVSQIAVAQASRTHARVPVYVYSPQELFANNEPGVWYDPSDLSTMFQDTAGTTPVTATGQTVGLLLDKSRGLVLGPELMTNGNFSSGATGWIVSAQCSIGSGIANIISTDGSFQSIAQNRTLTGGSTYELSFDVVSYTSGTPRFTFTGASVDISFATGTGRRVARFFVPTTVTSTLTFTRLAGVTSYSIDNISVRELPGNHATQATAASRPIYGIEPFGGRRNLLTFTEQFDNAAWSKTGVLAFGSGSTANATTAPDGTATADLAVEDSSNGLHQMLQNYTFSASGPVTISFYAKAATRSKIRVWGSWDIAGVFDLVAGTATGTGRSITPVGNGWYRCVYTGTVPDTVSRTYGIRILNDAGAEIYTGDGTSGILIWGAQLEAGSTATDYQQVTDQWNVTEAGVPSVSYLAFDGTDDFLVTPTITPGTDKVQVFAGVRKLSDAAAGVVVEGSANAGSNNGAFYVSAPDTNGSASYGFASRGTALGVAKRAVAAPITNVLTGIGDIAADTAILRINGTQVATSAIDQGTGNYLAYPLYIGRRGGTSLAFNGRIYQMIVRFGATLETTKITQTGTYVNSMTGAY